MNEFENEFNNSKIDSNDVLKRIDERNRLFLTRKSKNSISFKALNDFSLTSKSLSHDNNVMRIR